MLVSLAILGLIAGLAVPSIVISIDRSKNRNILKEAFQTISTITQAGVMNGDFSSITDWNITTSTDPKGIVAYISGKLNYSKQCVTADIASDGCTRAWHDAPPTIPNNTHNARWILSNGAKIQAQDAGGFNSSYMIWMITSKATGNMVYWGTNPDMIMITCNVTESTQVLNAITLKPGTCGPVNTGIFETSFNTALGYN